MLIAGCTAHRAPTSSLEQPPSQRIGHHTVSRGETLYSIAWRYGKDYREVAAVNRIAPPYRIYPGQKLKLTGSAPVAAAPKTVKKTRPTPPDKTAPAKKKRVRNKKSLTSKKPQKPDSRISSNGIRWQWPAKGKLISGFRSGDPLRKGVDIAGEKGDAVLAAANGTVIYAGSALRGYGKLLIVKHSEEFLSAYAHNHKLLVREGSEVEAGQRIAELGSSGTSRNMLHFEIRRSGQPVNPETYLP
ncbi:peptidoglycan DD-metalloendopeptidase family protein [Microbulbifer halophilus]|uniref:Peptidoglycan DD-metalloendopeptidase family protein n=1 Tax=Microbulbifer halophilus TaxID=453963 RepID=A0ABW5EF29_9GAMM|nr:peptidoglycan DD-metalloendopeptidase family protein [Microbulbifer halophilus]MCW8127802.1 peptidoglycan DD-metalloendopeptidase family protein [Microbulbifer halophilus]